MTSPDLSAEGLRASKEAATRRDVEKLRQKADQYITRAMELGPAQNPVPFMEIAAGLARLADDLEQHPEKVKL